MRDYGIVSPKFWTGKTGKSLRGNPAAQILALYLMTCPHANMIGVFHCPMVYMMYETGLDAEGASKALASLIEAQFCTYEEASETVFVHRMAAFQIAERLKPDDKRVKGVEREWSNIDSKPIKLKFFAIYSVAFHIPNEGEDQSPIEAPSKPHRSQEQDQEQDQEQLIPPADKSAGLFPGFAEFWKTWPSTDRKQAKGKCLDAWKKAHAERDAAVILAHVERMKSSGDWRRDNGQYIPAPLVYLNGRRWEGADEAVDAQQESFV